MPQGGHVYTERMVQIRSWHSSIHAMGGEEEEEEATRLRGEASGRRALADEE